MRSPICSKMEPTRRSRKSILTLTFMATDPHSGGVVGEPNNQERGKPRISQAICVQGVWHYSSKKVSWTKMKRAETACPSLPISKICGSKFRIQARCFSRVTGDCFGMVRWRRSSFRCFLSSWHSLSVSWGPRLAYPQPVALVSGRNLHDADPRRARSGLDAPSLLQLSRLVESTHGRS